MVSFARNVPSCQTVEGLQSDQGIRAPSHNAHVTPRGAARTDWSPRLASPARRLMPLPHQWSLQQRLAYFLPSSGGQRFCAVGRDETMPDTPRGPWYENPLPVTLLLVVMVVLVVLVWIVGVGAAFDVRGF